MGPILGLTLFWVGAAVPILDRDLVTHVPNSVSTGEETGHGPSHDHRLCILLKSSPGSLAVAPSPVDGPQISLSRDIPLESVPVRVSADLIPGPTARAPPSLS
jgi:hypothetical protein